MSDYTRAEVRAAIEEVTGGDDVYSDFWYDPSDYTLTLRGEQVRPEKVDSTGGMDEGSYASVVFKVGDQLFKKDGYYASHYGYDWDGDFYEVESYEKTVVDYRAI